MYNCIIIDDEAGARELLSNFLQRFFPDFHVAGQGGSVAEAVDLIDRVKPQLVFLDIELPLGTGFDVLDKVSFHGFRVIFISAYNQYAIDAFRISAVDYLLKPLKLKELREALSRFEERLLPELSAIPAQQISEAIKTHEHSSNKIVLPTLNGFEVLMASEIIRCEADRNYTRFILDSGRVILVSKTMKEFENSLSSQGFFRIHQSYIVNLNKIKRYFKGQGGEVEMSDGALIPVSRFKKDEFIRLFTDNL